MLKFTLTLDLQVEAVGEKPSQFIRSDDHMLMNAHTTAQMRAKQVVLTGSLTRHVSLLGSSQQ